MNKEKFDKVIEFIETHLDNFDMDVWVHGFEPEYGEDLCGSTACVAGWAAILNGWQLQFDHHNEPSMFVEKGDQLQHVETAGRIELELTIEEAGVLFHVDTLQDVKRVADEILTGDFR